MWKLRFPGVAYDSPPLHVVLWLVNPLWVRSNLTPGRALLGRGQNCDCGINRLKIQADLVLLEGAAFELGSPVSETFALRSGTVMPMLNRTLSNGRRESGFALKPPKMPRQPIGFASNTGGTLLEVYHGPFRAFSTLQVLTVRAPRESNPSFTACGRRDRVFRTFSRSLLTNAWIPTEAVQPIKYHQFTSEHTHNWSNLHRKCFFERFVWKSPRCPTSALWLVMLRCCCASLVLCGSNNLFDPSCIFTASRLHWCSSGTLPDCMCQGWPLVLWIISLFGGPETEDHQASTGNLSLVCTQTIPVVCGMLAPGKEDEFCAYDIGCTISCKTR